MRISLLLTCIFCILNGCRTSSKNESLTDSDLAAVATAITPITRAEWDRLVVGTRNAELGCVCEASDGAWVLFRYASIEQKVYKVSLAAPSPLDTCVKEKSIPNNCQLKF